MSQQRNYLHKKHGGASGGSNGRSSSGPTRVFVRQMPDQTVHTPPGAMYIIGGLGVLLGFGANIWQMITTFTAFWTMFNPKGTPVDPGKQPAIFMICGLIAVSFQFALIMLVFRLDTTWKKHRVTGGAPGVKGTAQAMRSTAIEVVQHVNLVVIWGGLGFVVDTIGDYTFIAVYTATLDPVTSTFIIFCYAVGLYALSTIAFVRSIEYLWAGFAAADNLKREHADSQR